MKVRCQKTWDDGNALKPRRRNPHVSTWHTQHIAWPRIGTLKEEKIYQKLGLLYYQSPCMDGWFVSMEDLILKRSSSNHVGIKLMRAIDYGGLRTIAITSRSSPLEIFVCPIMRHVFYVYAWVCCSSFGHTVFPIHSTTNSCRLRRSMSKALSSLWKIYSYYKPWIFSRDRHDQNQNSCM